MFGFSILLVAITIFQTVQLNNTQQVFSFGGNRRSLEDAHRLMYISQAIMENEPYFDLTFRPYEKMASLSPMYPVQEEEIVDMQLIEAMLNAVKAERDEWNVYCRQGRAKYRDDPCELEKLEKACAENLTRIETQYRALRQIWGDRRKPLTKIADSFNRTRRRVWGSFGTVGRRIIRNLGEDVAQILSAKHSLTRGVLRSLLRKQIRQELRTFALDQIVKNTKVTLPDIVCDDEVEAHEQEDQTEPRDTVEDAGEPEGEMVAIDVLIDAIYQEWFKKLEANPCQPQLIMDDLRAWVEQLITTDYRVEDYYGEGKAWETFESFVDWLIQEATTKDVIKTWKGDYSATFTPLVACVWCAPSTEEGQIILTVDLKTCEVKGSIELHGEGYQTTFKCVNGVPTGEEHTFYAKTSAKGDITGTVELLVGTLGRLSLDPITLNYEEVAGWLDTGLEEDKYILETEIYGSLDFLGDASGTRYFNKDGECEYNGIWEAKYDADL